MRCPQTTPAHLALPRSRPVPARALAQVEELWSLLHFIAPESFVEGLAPPTRLAPPASADAASALLSLPRVFSRELFLSLFGDMRTSEQVTGLRGVLKPFLLRRLKEDVHASLPPKEETIIEVEMTVIQKQYYRAVYEHNAGFLVSSSASAQQAPSLVNIVMELRKVSMARVHLRPPRVRRPPSPRHSSAATTRIS